MSAISKPDPGCAFLDRADRRHGEQIETHRCACGYRRVAHSVALAMPSAPVQCGSPVISRASATAAVAVVIHYFVSGDDPPSPALTVPPG
jgi:hypothetical protein